MKLYEISSVLIIAILAVVGGVWYNGNASEDIEQLQEEVNTEYKIVKTFVVDLKNDYMDVRDDCLVSGEYKETNKCQLIKDKHTDLMDLWKKLKELDKTMRKANNRADKIKDVMSTVESVKKAAVKLSEVL